MTRVTDRGGKKSILIPGVDAALAGAKPDITIEVDGDNFTVTSLKTIKFTLGEEYEADPGTGKVAKVRIFTFLETRVTEQRIYYIIIYKEGPSKKVLQFFMPLEPIYNKNFCFDEHNVYCEHCHKVWTIKNP